MRPKFLKKKNRNAFVRMWRVFSMLKTSNGLPPITRQQPKAARLGRAKHGIPRQVGFLDVIHVRHMHLPVARAPHPHHGPVLEHLAADGTSTHQEQVLLAQQLLYSGTRK